MCNRSQDDVADPGEYRVGCGFELERDVDCVPNSGIPGLDGTCCGAQFCSVAWADHRIKCSDEASTLCSVEKRVHCEGAVPCVRVPLVQWGEIA